MRKLKIGILGTRGIPNNYGGFEQFAQQLSAGLVQRGHQVWVYNSHRHPYKEKDWEGVQIIHCRDWEYRLGTWGQFFYDRNCINDARKRDFDILLHFGYTSDSIWHRQWPRKAINIVNMDGLEWKRKKYSRFTQRFLKWAESLAVKHADVLIADSLAIQKHIKDIYNKQPVFIPYGATIFTNPDPRYLEKFKLKPKSYYLVLARIEPENNIEMIVKGWMASKTDHPLLVIGNTSTRFGKYITVNYTSPDIIYAGTVYETELLNNLRYFSLSYFHGHSAGGTNPSLLEAMACGCSIAAHDNVFNKVVLGEEADYFSSVADLAAIINNPKELFQIAQRESINKEKIRTIYDPEKIVDAYVKLILNASS